MNKVERIHTLPSSGVGKDMIIPCGLIKRFLQDEDADMVPLIGDCSRGVNRLAHLSVCL